MSDDTHVYPCAGTILRKDVSIMKIPRQYSLVRFTCEYENWSLYPFRGGNTYIFLGEIPNMIGHCVVADYKSGQIFGGYHTDNFTEIPEDEV